MKKLVMDLPEINDYRMVEGLNQLKTNLAFCGKDIKVITMTSSVPNEGKSSISLSLSRTLAESGKKILMVDADLRKSVMAARYHIQGIDKGLSHYLTGQAEVEDIIYENEDNGYTVFEISGGGVLTVVCGIVGELHAGESVICRGRYENHATYGRQFHAQECETDMPKDLEAVYAFLASRSLPVSYTHLTLPTT